jgi:hypothetical protein
MRQAAGILMVAFALFLLIDGVFSVSHYGIDVYDLAFSLLLLIPTVFILTAGVFCLTRKYWKICYASALVTLVIMMVWLVGHAADSIALAWVVSVVGTLPIIFVSLTKREWQEIQG